MVSPDGDAAIIGCPKCGRNAAIRAQETPFTVADRKMTTLSAIECPHCGSGFAIRDNELHWSEE